MQRRQNRKWLQLRRRMGCPPSSSLLRLDYGGEAILSIMGCALVKGTPHEPHMLHISCENIASSMRVVCVLQSETIVLLEVGWNIQ